MGLARLKVSSCSVGVLPLLAQAQGFCKAPGQMKMNDEMQKHYPCCLEDILKTDGVSDPANVITS